MLSRLVDEIRVPQARQSTIMTVVSFRRHVSHAHMGILATPAVCEAFPGLLGSNSSSSRKHVACSKDDCQAPTASRRQTRHSKLYTWSRNCQDKCCAAPFSREKVACSRPYHSRVLGSSKFRTVCGAVREHLCVACNELLTIQVAEWLATRQHGFPAAMCGRQSRCGRQDAPDGAQHADGSAV